jgi:hypothetical protein
MNLQIQVKLLVPAVFLILVAGFFLTARAGRAADDCISKPNTAPPQGSHWYYRVDTNHRQCWYLGAEGAKVRPHQQQTASTLRSPSSPKPVAPPDPQTTAVAAAIPVTTTVIKVPAEDASITEMSVIETSGLVRPDNISSEGLLIASKRADERSAAETTEGEISARPIATASTPTTVEQAGLFEITFVHLVAVLAAVLALVAIIGRTIFRLPRVRQPGRTKVRGGSNNATTRHADAGRIKKPVMPQSSAAVAEIEGSVRRLLHELHQRQHRPHGEDFEPTRATDLDLLEALLADRVARSEAAR